MGRCIDDQGMVRGQVSVSGTKAVRLAIMGWTLDEVIMMVDGGDASLVYRRQSKSLRRRCFATRILDLAVPRGMCS